MSTYVFVYGCRIGASSEARSAELVAGLISSGLSTQGLAPLEPSDIVAVDVAEKLYGITGKRRPRVAGNFLVALKQIHKFTADSTLRSRAVEAVADTIASDTRVVVAHSLGSVAAYEALCLLPKHSVLKLVTLGSPLAIPYYIRGRLTPFSAFGRHAWPRNLVRWLNFYDARDLIARWPLQKHFGDGTHIEDRRVRLESSNPHSLSAYLSLSEVLHSIDETRSIAKEA